MKLQGHVELHVEGERILRRPGFFDKLKQALGGEPDLYPGKQRAALEASLLVSAVQEALARLGATNAVSLVIADVVIFQDKEGRPDDLTDLFLSFHEHADVFGKEFKLLRLAVEHEEAGIRYLLEVVAQSEHLEQDPAARLFLSGRLRDFEPRPGESADQYRARVEPLTATPAVFELHQQQFRSFVARVAEAMRAALPEARVEVASADARVERPSRRTPRRQTPVPPTDRRYDPFDHYYPTPYGSMLSLMIWSSLLHSAFHPAVMVVDPGGNEVGSFDDLAAGDLGGGLDGDLGGDLGGDLDGDLGGDLGGDLDGGGLFDGGGFDFGDFGDF